MKVQGATQLRETCHPRFAHHQTHRRRLYDTPSGYRVLRSSVRSFRYSSGLSRRPTWTGSGSFEFSLCPEGQRLRCCRCSWSTCRLCISPLSVSFVVHNIIRALEYLFPSESSLFPTAPAIKTRPYHTILCPPPAHTALILILIISRRLLSDTVHRTYPYAWR